MDALISAAQVIPHGPPDSVTSAAAILARWRARANIGLGTEEGDVLGSGAWEVGLFSVFPFPWSIAVNSACCWCCLCRPKSVLA